MKRILVCAAISAFGFAAVAAQEDRDPDRFKTSTALYLEGQKAEEKKDSALALKKYEKAVKKAKAEMNKEIGARALWQTARVNEALDPENIDGAKAAYEGIQADYSDVQPYADKAKEKLSYQGVDVWLNQIAKSLDAWRISVDRSPVTLTKKLDEEVWSKKIQPKDKDAVPGLTWGLGHPDEVVRDFSAQALAEVVDGTGVEGVIAKLNAEDANARAGASAALRRIYRKINDGAELDRQASALELQLSTVAVDPSGKAAAHHGKLGQEAAKLKESAKKIRHNLPETLDTPGIQGALEKIIGDENALPQARREAAMAASWIGRISGGLVDALIKGMESKDRNVREACARAAGAVDTSLSGDKHKLADVLIKHVQYEPAKDANKAEAVWANDDQVRQASAEALEKIALVKSLPALIEALDDNSALVRKAAYDALGAVTDKNLQSGTDEKTSLPKTYEPDAPLKDRLEAKAKWEEWWTATQGVVVLVERFWKFQAQWRDLSVVKLFEPAAFLKEVDTRKWLYQDPKAVSDRAERVVKEFQARKDVFVQDAVDLGAPAIDKLLAFIGGETERESRPSPGTRYFVAEAVAKSIEKNSANDAVAKVTALVGAGDSPAKKVGACIALGFLPKALAGSAEKAALQDQGLAAGEADVREAAAVALGKVGDEQSAAALTKGAGDAEAPVQIASLASLALIKPKNADTVKALGDMVADEPDGGGASKKSQNAGVRQYAVDALGEIADPASMQHLLRARRDTQRNVYEAAKVAIPKVFKADPAAAGKQLSDVFKDEKRKTDDRGGAALSVGETGDVELGKKASEQLIDLNAPRVLKDADPGVRIKICEGLGNLKSKSKTIVDRLLSCAGDETEREAVRNAAYAALKSIFEVDPDAAGSPDVDKKFAGSMPKDERSKAIGAWVKFVEGKTTAD
jgi:HEAT repeat protein